MKYIKKVISVILTAIMIASMLPMSAVNAQTVSVDDVLDASSWLKEYIDINAFLPSEVNVGGIFVNTAQYYKLACDAVISIYEESYIPLSITDVALPQSPKDEVNESFKAYKDSETAKALGIRRIQDDYIDMSVRNSEFIVNNGVAANYCSYRQTRNTTVKVGFENLVYSWAKILNYYNENGALPNYVTINSWNEFVSTPVLTQSPTQTPEPTPTPTPTPVPTVDAEEVQIDNAYTAETFVKAAERVYVSIENNKQLPLFVTVETVKFNMSSFLEALARTVIALDNSENVALIPYYQRKTIENSGEAVNSGSLIKEEYLKIAEQIISYSIKTDSSVSYVQSSIGQIGFETLVHLYSYILTLYSENGTLIESVLIKSWGELFGVVLPKPIPTDEISFSSPEVYVTPNISVSEENRAKYYIENKALIKAAERLSRTVEVNKKLPAYINMGEVCFTMPELLSTLAKFVTDIQMSHAPVYTVENPEQSAENMKSGTILKSEYEGIANSVCYFVQHNKMAPSYVSSSLGEISFEALLVMFAKTVYEYGEDGTLPASISVKSWADISGVTLCTPNPTSGTTMPPTPTPKPTPTPIPTFAPLFTPPVTFDNIAPIPTASVDSNIEGDTFNTGAVGTNGAVSSSSAYSSKIGLDILKKGGNAVDAAVATMFAVGLCEPSGSSIGGGGLAVIYLAEEDRYLIMDYMAQTPSTVGSTSVLSRQMCIPGMVHGAITMLNKYGTMTLSEVLDPVIELAKRGFYIDEEFVYRASQIKKTYEYPTNLFTKDINGGTLEAGDAVANIDLASTLTIIRDGGIEAFYNSYFTDEMVRYIQSIGGTIKKSDFQQYTSLELEPLKTNYRGYTVYAGAGSAQGGERVISMLNKMSNHNMTSYGHDSAQAVRATAVSFGMTSRGSSLGVKEDVLNLLDDVVPYDNKTTTMLTTYDKWGNAVAANVTLGHNYGCSVAVPGTGFCFNSGMSTSLGTSLSRVQSTMAPAIVANSNGKPMIIAGSPGDQAIITATAITISNILDFNMNVCEAVNAPRFFGYAGSSSMTLETRYSSTTMNTLRNWGYSLTTNEGEYSSGVGCVSAIYVDEDGSIMSAADNRREYMSFAY